MTRRGKIARLPHKNREELNRRFQDGASGNELVTWLDPLPEVNATLKAEFNSQPISPQNLSEWRDGGYRDWLLEQETKDFAANLAKEADELSAAAGALPTDKMALWLTARFMTVIKRLDASSTDDAIRSKLLSEAAAAFAALRRGDHSAERLKLARWRLGVEGESDSPELEKIARKWAADHGLEIYHKLTPEEQMEQYREIFGIDEKYAPTPKEDPPPAECQAESDQTKPNQA
jgi:hypothetical protein